MKTVRLATADGGHVADVNIPPFQSMPEVLVWGIRCFTFHCAISRDGDPACMEYREVFAYAVVDQVRRP